MTTGLARAPAAARVKRPRAAGRTGRAWIGISGYDYPGWKGRFYPPEVPRREWLRYASGRFNSIELNGTFYSLKSPAVFRGWVEETPGTGFVFAVKGSRFITHNLKLRRAEGALANFYASGLLALGRKTGPFLWQLPDSYRFDAARIDTFLRLLPRSSVEAEALARGHDARLKRGALVQAAARVRYRHAFEVRHPSYFDPAFFDLLRAHGIGYVIADTAGKWTLSEEVTADFVYVRLHGSQVLYGSDYTGAELEAWAARVKKWSSAGRDVYVYFDNDQHAYAPHDALDLARQVTEGRARLPRAAKGGEGETRNFPAPPRGGGAAAHTTRGPRRRRGAAARPPGPRRPS